MRLVSLSAEIPFRVELEFDPRVTLITGLGDEAQSALADVLEGVYSGRVEGLSGHVTLDGALLELSAETILRLELPADPPDARLRRRDLPFGDADALQADEDAQARTQAAADARAQLEIAVGQVAGAARAHADAIQRHLDAERRMAEVSAQLDELRKGREAVAQAIGSREDRAAEAADRRAALEALVIPADPGPVEAALVSLEEATTSDADVPRKAAELLPALDSTARELAAIPDRSTPGWEALSAGKLAEARAALAEEQAKAGLLGFKPDDVAALEQAHEKVGDAEERTGQRFGGGKARRRLEEARNEEQALLARMGLHSYTDLLLMTAVPSFDVESKDRIDAARIGLEEVQQRIDDPEEPAERLRRETLVALQAELRRQAAIVAGGQPEDEDLVTRLRDLTGRANADVPSLVEALRSALAEAIGAEPPSALEELAAVASAWLKTARPAWDAYEGPAIEERDEALRHVQEAQGAIAAETEAAASHELDAEAAALAQARREAADLLDRADNDKLQAEEALRLANDAVRHSSAAVTEAERVTAPAPPSHDDAGGDSPEDVASNADVHVLARIAAVRDVGGAGSLPLIVEDAFRHLPESARYRGLDLLARMASTLQIIYLSNDPDVEEWAREEGRVVSIAHQGPS